MTKTFSLFSLIVLLMVSCQSEDEKLKLTLKDNLIQYIKQEQINLNGSSKIDTCLVISVDSITDRQMDSLLLSKIRLQREVYDSMADDNLKRGSLYNHQAFTYQQSGDTTRFNLAILNATESHAQAGAFIDSSMAIQRTADFLRNKTSADSTLKKYLQAKVYLKATLFSTTDSSQIHDTLLFHFNRGNEVVDVNKRLKSLIRYD